MKCPKCGHEAKALETVHNHKENETYRAKKCVNCGHIIYTVEYEVIQNQRFAEDWAEAHHNYRKELQKKKKGNKQS